MLLIMPHSTAKIVAFGREGFIEQVGLEFDDDLTLVTRGTMAFSGPKARAETMQKLKALCITLTDCGFEVLNEDWLDANLKKS